MNATLTYPLPTIIQGGMGIGVSDWRLARVVSLRGGVTDTPALRKIPGHEVLLEGAARKNPSGRLTTPADVAGAIVALSGESAQWITGNVINVDGGEEIVV